MTPSKSAGHYFDSTPASPDVRRRIKADIWGRTFDFETAAGVFSTERLDAGTELLFEYVEPARRGNVLDLGCGWGPIACALAAADPELRVWAVDINERARDLTQRNAAAANVAIQVAEPAGVPAEVQFDEIWSNPPIRVGKSALHDLLTAWLPRLKPGGTAWLVVGKNLGADSLQRWLQDSGWPTERHASAKGFRILRVTKPPQ